MPDFFGVTPQKMCESRSDGREPRYLKLGPNQQSRRLYEPEAIREFIEQHTIG